MSKPTVVVGQATKKLDYDSLVKFVSQGDTIDGSGADTTLLAADFGRTVIVNSASARSVFLPSVDSAHIGGWFVIVKLGAGNVTIDAADSDTINGGAAGGTLVNDVSGEGFAYVKVRLISATAWLIEAGMGSWTTSANMFLLGYPDGPRLKQISTPSTPAAGFDRLYPKSDKLLYHLDSDGSEWGLAHKYNTMPSLGARRCAGFRAAGAGFLTLMATLTTGGTSGILSDLSDDVSNWTGITITVGVGNTGHVYASGSSILVRRNHLFDATFRILVPASKPNFRWWIGLTDAHFTDNSDNPASRHLAMFRWSYNVGAGANWYAVTKDGTTINAQDTGVAMSVSTAYLMRIWAESGKVCFTINGANKQELTVNLPGASTALLLEAIAVSNDGAAGWQPRIGSGYVEFNG